MAQHREDFFERVFILFSVSCWNLTGLILEFLNHPVKIQNHEEFFQEGVLSQSLPDAGINRFISLIIPLWHEITKTFSRKVLSQSLPGARINGGLIFESLRYGTKSRRLFRESFWKGLCLVLKFNGFYTRIIPLWRSIAKTLSRGSFKMFSAWCSKLTGLIPVNFLNHQAQSKDFFEFILNQSSPHDWI